jgi:transcription elongation factor Elf1
MIAVLEKDFKNKIRRVIMKKMIQEFEPAFKRNCKECGTEAEHIGCEQNGRMEFRCPKCGNVFTANPGSLETWDAKYDAMVDFFIRRKAWARELLASRGLSKPCESTTGVFDDDVEYTITIGPRGGVRIGP